MDDFGRRNSGFFQYLTMGNEGTDSDGHDRKMLSVEYFTGSADQESKIAERFLNRLKPVIFSHKKIGL